MDLILRFVTRQRLVVVLIAVVLGAVLFIYAVLVPRKEIIEPGASQAAE